MSGKVGRISMPANQGATGALFGIAIMSFALRLYIQIRVLRRFAAEDWILVAATACLVACTGFYYDHLQYTYNSLRASLDGFQEVSLLEIIQDVPVQLKTATILLTLWWVTIFAVKMGYLLFFRKLIFRVRGLMRWWWVVMGFMGVAFIVNVVVSAITCPYPEVTDVLEKCARSGLTDKIPKMAIATTVLDVVSDILIVSIPIALLRRVRIAFRQKLGLGVVLCLSLVMAIIALVRIGALWLPIHAIDEVWVLFWLQQECSVAVIMVSITAFRSFFVVDNQPSPGSGSPGWYVHLSRVGSAVKRGLRFPCLRSRQNRHPEPLASSSEDARSKEGIMIRSTDPKIPGGTITGIRSALDRGADEHEVV